MSAIFTPFYIKVVYFISLASYLYVSGLLRACHSATSSNAYQWEGEKRTCMIWDGGKERKQVVAVDSAPYSADLGHSVQQLHGCVTSRESRSISFPHRMKSIKIISNFISQNFINNSPRVCITLCCDKILPRRYFALSNFSDVLRSRSPVLVERLDQFISGAQSSSFA